MNIEELLANPDNIPMLPETAIRLQELLSSDTSTVDDIADVVSVDPTLTSKLLKIANSAFYSFASKIDTVSRAINVIGSEAVYNLALANSAVDSFSKLGTDCIDLDRFWRQSVDTGLIARELARSLRIPNSERLFVCGLLSNLGELICADQIPDKARLASSDNQEDPTLPWVKQRNILGFTYSELTHELMKIWRLPVPITDTIGGLYTPEINQNTESALLQIAGKAAIGLGETQRFQPESLISQEDLDNIGANQEILQNAIDYSNLEALNILTILSPQTMAIY